ncbi:hypothetical protein LL936_10480 [Levilactobacillus brevis]|uniref:hypothetical protein n=1 Tax=Levilactobacillus brevis TaxID=1580 RepID=UPI001C1E9D56|nr:hypothetical protein [Levilactobacillus brevis]MBU7540468.1 hypothetical protein [Levilactobacillus brevis]MBU7559915.1 hypothetical protein [Levilactobacillus brevis]MBU7566626.1 hypothetical protein [Levilactobacillus brevis]MCE6011474.1 hypothetical protein [Levilactobacillus brevis]MCE6013836.1 hypothetical protein [Levilactobacillus brevis]
METKTYQVPTPNHRIWIICDQVGIPVTTDQKTDMVPLTITDEAVSGKGILTSMTLNGQSIEVLVDRANNESIKLPAGIYQFHCNTPEAPAKAILQLALSH